MRDVLVVRHGESAWNAAGRWQGWLDVPLTPAGVDQARARGRALAGDGLEFAAIYCSDLSRARHTAELIAEALDAPPPVAHPGFRERHGGVFQGLTRDELAARYPDELAAWRAGTLEAPTGGETAAEILERFDVALGEAHRQSAPGALLVVTHGGLTRAVTRRAGLDASAVIGNCECVWFAYDGEELGPPAESRDAPRAGRNPAPVGAPDGVE